MIDIPETWAVVEGFPNYAVSTHGRVLNMRMNRYMEGHYDEKSGITVGLRRDGKISMHKVHHLVCAAFIQTYHPSFRIRHHDGDKRNNRVDNFRFANGRGLGKLPIGEDPPILRWIHIKDTDKYFRSVAEAARNLGYSTRAIYNALDSDRSLSSGETLAYVFR